VTPADTVNPVAWLSLVTGTTQGEACGISQSGADQTRVCQESDLLIGVRDGGDIHRGLLRGTTKGRVFGLDLRGPQRSAWNRSSSRAQPLSGISLAGEEIGSQPLSR